MVKLALCANSASFGAALVALLTANIGYSPLLMGAIMVVNAVCIALFLSMKD